MTQIHDIPIIDGDNNNEGVYTVSRGYYSWPFFLVALFLNRNSREYKKHIFVSLNILSNAHSLRTVDNIFISNCHCLEPPDENPSVGNYMVRYNHIEIQRIPSTAVSVDTVY